MDIPFELIILLLFFLLPAISKLFEKKRPEQAPPPESHYPEPSDGGEAWGRTGAHERAGAAEPESLEEALRQIREALGQPAPQAERRPEPPARVPQRPEPMRRPDAEHTRRGPDTARPGPEPMRLPEPEHLQRRAEEHVRPGPEPMRARAEPIQPREPRVRARTRFEKDPALSKPLEVEVISAIPAEHAWLVEALRSPDAASRAIKLHEVLEAPRSVGWRRFRRR